MSKFSQRAHEWVQSYHGSIDTTALLMAYDAGFAEGDRWRLAVTMQQVVREDAEALDMLAGHDRAFDFSTGRYEGDDVAPFPTEEQINDWNIHNDHTDSFEKDAE